MKTDLGITNLKHPTISRNECDPNIVPSKIETDGTVHTVIFDYECPSAGAMPVAVKAP